MLRGMRRTATLLALLCVACSEAEHPSDFTIELLGSADPLAVLARQQLAVRDGCEAPARCLTEPCCTTQNVTVLSATVDAAAATASVLDRGVLLAAAAPGQATLTVRASLDGEEAVATRTVRVLAPDRVTLSAPIPARPDRRDDLVCLPPALFEQGTSGVVPYRALAGAETLVTEGWMPVVSSGPAVQLDGLGGSVTLPTQRFIAAQPGEATLFAEVGQRSSVAIRVVDTGDYDDVRVASSGDLAVGQTVRVEAPLQVDRQDVCNDTATRVVYIDSPGICRLAATQPGGPAPASETQTTLPASVVSADVFGLAPGTCVVRVRVMGSNFEATASITTR